MNKFEAWKRIIHNNTIVDNSGMIIWLQIQWHLSRSLARKYHHYFQKKYFNLH